jgi:putative spermidine/putrescine transport system permease protein
MNLGAIAFRIFVGAIFVFIAAPLVVVLVASISTTAYVVFPPTGFTLRWFFEVVTLNQYMNAFRFSLITAVAATALSLVLGAWIALALKHAQFKGRDLLVSFFMSPIILPELALAIGLLQYFSMIGMLRGTVAIILAHSVVCTPYVVRTVYAAATRLDPALVDSARSLGATPARALRDITIPLLKPGLIGGGIMAFVISFDNVTISLMLASPGNIALPALLFNQAAEVGLSTTLAAICAMLVIFMGVLMLIVDKAIGLDRFFQSTGGH